MQITKIFNNNAVEAMDGEGREVVAVGPGIGFQRRRGEQVDEQAISRVYRRLDGRSAALEALISSLPVEVLVLGARVAETLRAQHAVALPTAVEVALADHVWRTLQEVRSGSSRRCAPPWDVVSALPRAHRCAQTVAAVVEQLTGVRLPSDEPGWIALHLAEVAGDSGGGPGDEITDAVRRLGTECGMDLAPGGPAWHALMAHLDLAIHRARAAGGDADPDSGDDAGGAALEIDPAVRRAVEACVEAAAPDAAPDERRRAVAALVAYLPLAMRLCQG